MSSSAAIDEFLLRTNKAYEARHLEYESHFWSTKMALAGASTQALTASKQALDDFLGDAALLAQTRSLLAADAPTPPTEAQAKVLRCFERTFSCYIVESEEARAIGNELRTLEAELAQARNRMPLGHESVDGSGAFVPASSVQLRTKMSTSECERTRRACFLGMRSIGPFVVERFCEIVKKRNRLARAQGFEDYYDMKCTQAEGFSKRTLFDILEPLEAQTRGAMQRARAAFAAAKGETALEPHNMGFFMSGNVVKLKDPFFPFQNAVDVWARSFAALGITYRGAEMRLDLCDRPSKYSNGFCHWPQPAWQSPTGWVPSRTNFTSLASPKAVGSGLTAITTLMHEAGHAAHFANVLQQSPLFSQERAPTSVAYAENQSMFLDSLVGDAAWAARYARNAAGEPIPWDVLEADLRAKHPYQVFTLRAMIAVPFFEKALYELAEADVTPARVQQLADEVETRIQGGLTARPLLSVPHILSDESSAYYHGYVLAEMSVYQTRAHFLAKYGSIVDNAQVGRDLSEIYWAPGNGENFRDLVQHMTGKPLSADAWVADLEVSLEQALADEKAAYDEALAAGPKFAAGTAVDLDMRVMLVHGDEVVADSAQGGLVAACETYRKWLDSRA